jgi:chromosome segregation ATPase
LEFEKETTLNLARELKTTKALFEGEQVKAERLRGDNAGLTKAIHGLEVEVKLLNEFKKKLERKMEVQDGDIMQMLEEAKNLSLQNRQNYDSILDYSKQILQRTQDDVGGEWPKTGQWTKHHENLETSTRRRFKSPGREPENKFEAKKMELLEVLEENKGLSYENRQEFDNLVSELAKSGRMVLDLKGEIAQQKTELQTQVAVIRNYEEGMGQERSTKSQLEAKVMRLKSENISLNEQVTKLQKNVDMLSKCIEEQEKTNSQLMEEVECSKKTEVDMRIALANEKEVNEVLTTRLDAEQSANSTHKSIMDELERELRGIGIERGSLQTSLHSSQQELAKTRISNTELKNKLDLLKDENSQKHSSIRLLESRLDNTENVIIKDLKEATDHFTNDNSCLKGDVASLKEKIREYKDGSIKHEYEVRVMNIELDSEKKMNAQLEKDKDSAMTEVRALRDNIEALRVSAQNGETDRINMQYDLKIMKGEFDIERKSCEKMNAVIEGLNSEIRALRSGVDEERSKVNNERNDKLRLDTEIKMLMAEIEGKKEIATTLETEVERGLERERAMGSELDARGERMAKMQTVVETQENTAKNLSHRCETESSLNNQLKEDNGRMKISNRDLKGRIESEKKNSISLLNQVSELNNEIKV